MLLVLFALGLVTYLTVPGGSAGRSVAASPGEDRLSMIAQPGGEGDEIVGYYFHVTVRCITCRTIEKYAGEAMKQYFPRELATGKLEWRPVNVQLRENRHFIQDYQLFTRSLVLVWFHNGKQREYKNLERTWELVGNEEDFKHYVKHEVKNYLEKLT